MSSIKMFDKTGASVGEVQVPEGIMVADKGAQAVRDAIVATMAARRTGSASTLTKGEVAGSNKKPWKQKGTGRARAGLRQSPVWRGGGVAFGPHPRDYSQKINKKVAKLAFRRAMSDMIAEGAVKIIDDITIAEPRTKLVVGMLKGLGLESALIVTAAVDPVIRLASRNIPKVEAVAASEVNVYQVVRYPAIVISRPAWEILCKRMGAGEASANAKEEASK